MTQNLILLKIPKYLISDLTKHPTCSSNRKVSSRVDLKYSHDVTLLIVISRVTISSSCFGIGLFVAWNSMKLVLSQFIVNLFHHRYNSLNFDTIFDIRLFKLSPYINRAVSSANSLIQSCKVSRFESWLCQWKTACPFDSEYIITKTSDGASGCWKVHVCKSCFHNEVST